MFYKWNRCKMGSGLLLVRLYYGLCNIFCSFDLHPPQIFIRCYCTAFVLWGKDCKSTSFKYSLVLHEEMEELSSQLRSNSRIAQIVPDLNFFRAWFHYVFSLVYTKITHQILYISISVIKTNNFYHNCSYINTAIKTLVYKHGMQHIILNNCTSILMYKHLQKDPVPSFGDSQADLTEKQSM